LTSLVWPFSFVAEQEQICKKKKKKEKNKKKKEGKSGLLRQNYHSESHKW